MPKRKSARLESQRRKQHRDNLKAYYRNSPKVNPRRIVKMLKSFVADFKKPTLEETVTTLVHSVQPFNASYAGQSLQRDNINVTLGGEEMGKVLASLVSIYNSDYCVSDTQIFLKGVVRLRETRREPHYVVEQVTADEENGQLETIKQLIQKCQHHKIAISLVLRGWWPNFQQAGHQNLLMVDTQKNFIERFDPHGYNADDYYNISELIDEELYPIFVKLGLVDYDYYPPQEFCAGPGPQMGEKFTSKELASTLTGSFGYCQYWTLLYAHLRFMSPQSSPKEVVDAILNIEERFTFMRKYATLMTIWIYENNPWSLEKRPNLTVTHKRKH